MGSRGLEACHLQRLRAVEHERQHGAPHQEQGDHGKDERASIDHGSAFSLSGTMPKTIVPLARRELKLNLRNVRDG
jgi:hypothetical protein